jgi:hypothetical protein
VLQSAEQGGETENSVDIEHQRRVDRVAHQRRRAFPRHHDREDDDFDGDRRQRQDHRAVGIADLDGKDFRMVCDAHRRQDDGADEGGGCNQRRALTHLHDVMLGRIGDHADDERRCHVFFVLQA